MKNTRSTFLTALLLTGLATSSQAQAQDFVSTVQSGLSGVNDIVQQGCGYVNQAGNIPVIGGWTSQNMQWVCSIAMMSDYVNGMVNAGTWESFGKQLFKGWADDALGTMLANKDVTGLNKVTDSWYKNLTGSVDTFKSNVQGMTNQYMLSRVMGNSNNAPESAAGIADDIIHSNPALMSAEIDSARKASTSLMQMAETQAQQMQSEKAKKAQNGTLQTTLSAAATVTSPLDGISTTYKNAARAATSSRELAQLQVEATADMMNQLAVYNPGVVASLTNLAEQQTITNYQLGVQSQILQQKAIDDTQAVRDEIEATVTEAQAGSERLIQLGTATTQGLYQAYNPPIIDMKYDTAKFGYK